jgi:hypothetical protein
LLNKKVQARCAISEVDGSKAGDDQQGEPNP